MSSTETVCTCLSRAFCKTMTIIYLMLKAVNKLSQSLDFSQTCRLGWFKVFTYQLTAAAAVACIQPLNLLLRSLLFCPCVLVFCFEQLFVVLLKRVNMINKNSCCFIICQRWLQQEATLKCLSLTFCLCVLV